MSYTYIDGVPVIPGYEAHNWRSWYNSHHYNTHSLGPVMQITGLRPESVVAYEIKEPLPGFIPTKDSARIGASLIHMSNGGVVRNLIGASSCDTHSKRIWGTRGFLDFTGNCYVRIGREFGPANARRRFSLIRATPPLDSWQSIAVLENGLFHRFTPFSPKISVKYFSL